MLKNLTETSQATAQNFLNLGDAFKLGDLPTEQQAPETINLAENSKTNLPHAINQIKSLDTKTLSILASKVPELEAMYKSICATFDAGNRIFICGCGATGRLSLALEQLFKQEADSRNLPELRGSVISLMAGGDLALIKSVEDFEDHPEFAVQHMIDVGFGPNDLLIASTEGGETPWVIGATNHAAETSSRTPFFLYCNPDDKLKVQRSKDVIANPAIHKINLTVGPMGITGSTRMQSTTILMYAIGLPLFHTYHLTGQSKEEANASFLESTSAKVAVFSKLLESTNLHEIIAPFTERESQTYLNNGYMFYETTAYFGLSVLTDTTERSPTFSLFPFENQQDIGKAGVEPSLVHLVLVGTKADPNHSVVEAAWRDMLGGREIRGLDSGYWEAYENKVATKRALGYNFSPEIIGLRKGYTAKDAQHLTFDVERVVGGENGKKIELALRIRDSNGQVLNNCLIDMSVFNGCRLSESIFLKVILNSHSTLVMCRMDKVKSNIMIWVRPSNFKLIDRAIRYVTYFINERKEELIAKNPAAFEAINYELICNALTSESEKLNYGQAIVLLTVQRILADLFDITTQI